MESDLWVMGKEPGESSDRRSAAWGEFQATAQGGRNPGSPGISWTVETDL